MGSRAQGALGLVVLLPALFAVGCAPGDGNAPSEHAGKGSAPLSDSIYTVDGWMSVDGDYIPRVCTQENGAAGAEALKAQAVAARTYLATAIKDAPSLGTPGNPVGNGQFFQAYAPSASQACIDATSATRGQLATFGGSPIIANYVAGSLWNADGSKGNDYSATEHWVTYNDGLTGSAVHPTALSYLARSDNRGCMSQNGADWLSRNGYDYAGILRYFYGADLSLDGGSGSTGSGGGGCTGLSDGLYCGGDAVSGDAGTLFQCSGGSLSVSQVCGNGCQVNSNGVNDACVVSSGPSGDCAGLKDGLYCGSDYVNGDAGTLYQCSGEHISVSQVCGNGCQVNSAGMDDQCN